MIALENVLKDAKNHVFGESKTTFQIEFLKTNRDKKTGGEFVTILRAQKTGLKNVPGFRHCIGIYDHDTGRKWAVHERLIFKYNGQEVYW